MCQPWGFASHNRKVWIIATVECITLDFWEYNDTFPLPCKTFHHVEEVQSVSRSFSTSINWIAIILYLSCACFIGMVFLICLFLFVDSQSQHSIKLSLWRLGNCTPYRWYPRTFFRNRPWYVGTVLAWCSCSGFQRPVANLPLPYSVVCQSLHWNFDSKDYHLTWPVVFDRCVVCLSAILHHLPEVYLYGTHPWPAAMILSQGTCPPCVIPPVHFLVDALKLTLLLTGKKL